MSLFFSFIYGFVMWSYLLIKNRKTVYIISDQGIGDIFPSCGFLPSFRSKNNISHITVLGVKGKQELYKMYEKTFDNLVLFSSKHYQYMCKFSSLDVGYAFGKITNRIISTRIGSNSRGNYMLRMHQVTYLDSIKYGVYDLPIDSILEKPQIPACDIQSYIDSYELKQGKTVILNPYANSISNLPLQFFTKLAERLKKNGFCVVTNLSGSKQSTVPGTKGITCSLTEAYHLAEFCGCAIGMRSGFFDFVAYAKCKLIILFPYEYPFFEYQKLSKWGINTDAIDMKVGSNWNEDILNICNIVLEG